MGINSLNIARNFESYNSFNNKSDKSKDGNSNDLSIKVTEKYEPGKSRSNNSESSINLNPQYVTSAPVSKLNISSKDIFEIVHYQDNAEKIFCESQIEKIKSRDINPKLSASEEVKEIKTGFYLTIPKSDLEKLSTYVKNSNSDIEIYNASNKTKKGVIVNLTV